MRTLFRVATTAAISAATFLVAPETASAQPAPSGTISMAGDWEVLVRPRVGFIRPQWDYAEGRRIPERPAFGVELLMRPKNSWYGVRVLFERSTPWSQADLPEWPDSSPFPGHFESFVGDAVLYPVPGIPVKPYFFGGVGYKSFSVTDETGILPYSFSGSVRKTALHGGIGFEVPLGGARAALEAGDLYGETRETGKVHNVHVTFMIGFPSLRDLFEDLGGDESDNPE